MNASSVVIPSVSRTTSIRATLTTSSRSPEHAAIRSQSAGPRSFQCRDPRYRPAIAATIRSCQPAATSTSVIGTRLGLPTSWWETHDSRIATRRW